MRKPLVAITLSILKCMFHSCHLSGVPRRRRSVAQRRGLQPTHPPSKSATAQSEWPRSKATTTLSTDVTDRQTDLAKCTHTDQTGLTHVTHTHIYRESIKIYVTTEDPPCQPRTRFTLLQARSNLTVSRRLEVCRYKNNTCNLRCKSAWKTWHVLI